MNVSRGTMRTHAINVPRGTMWDVRDECFTWNIPRCMTTKNL